MKFWQETGIFILVKVNKMAKMEFGMNGESTIT